MDQQQHHQDPMPRIISSIFNKNLTPKQIDEAITQIEANFSNC